MRTARAVAVVLFVILGVVLISLSGHRSDFARDLRSVAANSNGMELCNFRGEEAQDCAELGGSPRGSALLQALSTADASLGPGKNTILSERILRIRARGTATGQYAGCYRLVEFEGFTGIYVTEVEMDRGCVRIARFMTGEARIFPAQ